MDHVTIYIILAGALGLFMAWGIGALNPGVIGNIFMSWIITLPAGALLAIFFFYFFKGLRLIIPVEFTMQSQRSNPASSKH